jgi:peptide deformylase
MPKPHKIIKIDNPILRRQADPVQPTELASKKIQTLAQNMLDSVKDRGVGLAAPQIGISKRIFVINFEPEKKSQDNFVVVINPRILAKSEEMEKDGEGCLSVPGIMGIVPRHCMINIEYTSLSGEIVKRRLTDYLARVFQHEYDHLDGILYLDRVENKAQEIMTEAQYFRLLEM